MKTPPFFIDDAIVFGILITLLGLVFYTSSSSKTQWTKFYKVVPALLLCYLLPAILNSFAPDLIFPMAETLQTLGSDKAWLVHGSDGSDEITITGPTAVAVLANGKITSLEVHPEDAGLPVHPLADILGGTPEVNTKALMALMNGEAGAYRDAVLLNAAAALMIADKAETLKDLGFRGWLKWQANKIHKTK